MNNVISEAFALMVTVRVYVNLLMNFTYETYVAFWQEYEETSDPKAHEAARLWYARYLKVKQILEADDETR